MFTSRTGEIWRCWKADPRQNAKECDISSRTRNNIDFHPTSCLWVAERGCFIRMDKVCQEKYVLQSKLQLMCFSLRCADSGIADGSCCCIAVTFGIPCVLPPQASRQRRNIKLIRCHTQAYACYQKGAVATDHDRRLGFTFKTPASICSIVLCAIPKHCDDAPVKV